MGIDLGAIRHNRGVTLEQIAASTKIGLRYLRAIEAQEFERLPPGVYAVSYLRQYARAIDYEEGALVQLYLERANSDRTALRPADLSPKEKAGLLAIFSTRSI